MTQIPEWANWLARDEDGTLYAFESRPYSFSGEWMNHGEVEKVTWVEETDTTYSHVRWEDEHPTQVNRRNGKTETFKMVSAPRKLMTLKEFDKLATAQAHGFDEPPTMDTVNKPNHYCNKEGKDLFQKWYEEHDLPTFRAIMRATAERYTTRYEHKNGIEDLEKGIYTLRRLKEYEEENCGKFV